MIVNLNIEFCTEICLYNSDIKSYYPSLEEVPKNGLRKIKTMCVMREVMRTEISKNWLENICIDHSQFIWF